MPRGQIAVWSQLLRLQDSIERTVTCIMCFTSNREALRRLISTVFGVFSCECVLCLALSTVAEADDIKAGQSERKGGQVTPTEMTVQRPWGHFIQGDVVRVDHGNYFVKDKNGKNFRLATDSTTQVMGEFKTGDRILAKVIDQNHVLSIIPAP
jgi:hypothetical protein